MILTGRVGMRFGWFGKLVVQVEVEDLIYPGIHVTKWKDATLNQYLLATKQSFAARMPSKESK